MYFFNLKTVFLDCVDFLQISILFLHKCIHTEFSKLLNTISLDSRSHREIFAFLSYFWWTIVAEMIRRTINKELPDGNRETNDWYYPEAFWNSSIFLFLRDFWFVQQDTRNICVTCIFHGANGFPVTIVNIGGSIPFLQDDREYRRLSANEARKPEGSTRRIGVRWRGNWKSLAAISLSILYYRLDIAWKRRNVVCNKLSLAILD